MNSSTKRVIEHCSNSLNQGHASLVQVIDRLGIAGVESCHADYRIPALVFYSAEGDAYSLPLPLPEEPVAATFDRPALQIALDATHSFTEFKRCTLEAGCIGFFLWLDGRHATFLGRHGEIHDMPLEGHDVESVRGQVIPFRQPAWRSFLHDA
ncbi:hypothetical protein [Pseudomonas sp. Gutcm_11s]|uniref:hypothetical protein n=1 Tax=Pseudomonas sp. Gutcm_11s TaxID=3026088 RepID=UPI0023615068|nr:hypothetical protein [Pseudomonas sp. Gutcm_11s]MDD0842026.1 hypothetical protein [Pseudomonas sp. Gutcm_11s]